MTEIHNEKKHDMATRAGILAVLLGLCVSGSLRAGGPLAVNGTGQPNPGEPMKWSTAGPIVYNPDLGGLGTLDNFEARQLFREALDEWQALGVVTFSEGELLPSDIVSTNWRNYWRVPADGYSPIVFDDDGSAIDGLFGIGARFDILGIGGIDDVIAVDTTIDEGSVIVNGLFYDGVGLPSSPEDLSREALKAVMVHEIGHFLSLDHSIVNQELAGDGDPDNDVYLPTMYPVTSDDQEVFASLNPDDIANLKTIYSTSPATGISGVLRDSAGNPLQGAHVVLRKTDDPLMTAYGSISGGRFFPCNAGSTCDPCNTACNPGNPTAQGEYTVQFIEPGAYTIEVEQVDLRFSLSAEAFVGPLANPPVLDGPEEFYDAGESGADTDNPDAKEQPTAGLLTRDIQLNALPATDSFEPNDSLGQATPLPDIGSGRDTVAGYLSPGDLDFYSLNVVAGQRLRIDVDSFELADAAGVANKLDAIVALYDDANQLVTDRDDAIDPDTGQQTFDPEIEILVSFTGEAKIALGVYPDTDLDGTGGTTQGGYWLRVDLDEDTDGDGIFDRHDLCPATVDDDADRDGVCADVDNCPNVANTLQDDVGDGDGIGDACDNCPFASNPSQTDTDSDGIGDACETCSGTDVDTDGDGICDAVDDCATLANPTQGAASTVQLTQTPTLRARRLTLTPDETRIVIETGDFLPRDLYSVPLAGGSEVQLNDPADDIVGPYFVTDTHVVYIADLEGDSEDDLWSVPVDGTPGAVMLNDPVGGFLLGRVEFARPNPSATHVVYTADVDVVTTNKFELFVAPIDGSASPIRLNDTHVFNRDVTEFFVTDTHAVYRADRDIDDVFEWFAVPLTGGTVTQLHPDSLDVEEFILTPDGSRAVFVDDIQFTVWSAEVPSGASVQLYDGVNSGPKFPFLSSDAATVYWIEGNDLFTAPIDGSSAAQQLTDVSLLGPNSAVGLCPGSQRPTLSPDGNTIVYCAGRGIFSVPATGGTPIQLSGTSRGFIITSDSSRVITGSENLPIGGGTPIALPGSIGTSRNDLIGITDDGFLIGSNATGVRIDGTGRAVGGVGADDLTLHPDGRQILYGNFQGVFRADLPRLDGDGDGILDACDVCIGVADPAQSDADGDGDGDACDPCPNFAGPAGSDSDGDGLGNCGTTDNCPFASNPGQEDTDGDGSGDACDYCELNSSILNPGTVEIITETLGYTLIQDDQRLVLERGESFGGNEMRIETKPVAGGQLLELARSDWGVCPEVGLPCTSGGCGVGYCANDYSQICASDPECGGATCFVTISYCSLRPQPSPDGQTVYFLASLFTESKIELFSVPVGGGTPRRVSAPLIPQQGDVVDFRLSPDGLRLIYRADANVDEKYELFSVESFGGVPVSLSGDLGSDRDVVFSAEITPDGATVIYVADQDVDNEFEIFSVSILGGDGTRRQLNHTLGAGDRIQEFRLTPDGSRVVYLAGPAGYWDKSLYAATIGVSESGTLMSGTTAFFFPDLWFLADDGNRAVYFAAEGAMDPLEAYSALLSDASRVQISSFGGTLWWADMADGGDRVLLYAYPDTTSELDMYGCAVDQPCGSPTPLSTPSDGLSVNCLQISPDETTVAIRTTDGLFDPVAETPQSWLCAPTEPDVLDLFSVPITGGAPVDLNPDLGNPAVLGFTRDSARLAFEADGSGGFIVDSAGGTPQPVGLFWSESFAFSGGDATALIHGIAGSWMRIFAMPTDADSDGAQDYCDVCLGESDPTQADQDLDGVGDLCDNCPTVANTGQIDSNGDGLGDACETLTEGPRVVSVSPPDAGVDVSPATDVTLVMNEAVDPATLTEEAFVLSAGGRKVPGKLVVGADGVTIGFNPDKTLELDTEYKVEVLPLLLDLLGNPAVPFTSVFDTADSASSGTIFAGPSGGASATIGGANADDNAGFATAAVGSVDGDPFADLVIGAPNADRDAGTPDAGKVTIVFGSVGLTEGGPIDAIELRGVIASEFVGKTVARAGDVGGPFGPDGIPDFLIGAPDANGQTGRVYLVFGSAGFDPDTQAGYDLDQLASCSGAFCGVIFVGTAPGNETGAAISVAGDINDDGFQDLAIGAPGASADRGQVHVVFGPFQDPGGVPVNLGSAPGLILAGEAAGDRAGASVSEWTDPLGLDDLLIGAPLATANDEDGSPLIEAGLVYAVHGGPGNLGTSGTINLSRVANGGADEVNGVVFVGHEPGSRIGRSVSGAVDIDDDGVDDVLVGAYSQCFLIGGDGPKGLTGSSRTGGPTSYAQASLRTPDGVAVEQFEVVRYLPGADGDVEGLNVAPAGDLNNDGIEDFMIGAPLADPGGVTDAGKAYVVFGSTTFELTPEVELSQIGSERPGLAIVGAETGDQLGASVDGGFDLDGDGVDDALIGAPFADSLAGAPDNAGETYIISPVSPDEVQRIDLTHDPITSTTTLEWTVTERAQVYHLYRGTLDLMQIAGEVRTLDWCAVPGACRCDVTTDANTNGKPDTTDTDDPGPGEVLVYLATGDGPFGEGPIGPADAVPVRRNNGQCP